MNRSNQHKPPSFGALVQSFFADYLSPAAWAEYTGLVAAYRDAFLLFLEFAQTRLHQAPTAMQFSDLTPALIMAFRPSGGRPAQLGSQSPARLAALRTFLRFVAREDVASLHIVEQALGVPMKRFGGPCWGS